MAQTDQIRKGMFIMYNNEPNYITEAEFYSPGKGSAFTRVKLKSLSTGKVIPFTFKSGERVEELEVSFKTMQYLYNDDSYIFFMDTETYEQFQLKKMIGEQYLPFMKEGNDYVVGIYQDTLVTIKFPAQVILEITETGPAVRGNTANNAMKDAVVETGHKIQVPLFIDVGEKVKIDPETSAYQGRATE
jgi:elongation factor P